MLKRLEALIASPRGPLRIATLALLLALPALRLGFQADDHILAWQVEHHEPAWSLFHASESMLRQGRDNGAIAWWASPQLSVFFFRPLASISHFIELTLWPNAAWLMLLFNVLIYVGCAYAAALIYRELGAATDPLDVSVAALATLMFAVDDAHAHSVGWISGRNTVLALLGSLLALLFHVRARARNSRPLMAASTVAVVLALLSAEAGTWSVAYLLAYAWTFEPGSPARRLRTLWPQLGIATLWVLVYALNGFGLRGSSWYRELSSPLTATVQGVLDLPLSLTSLFGPSMIGFAILQPTHIARWLALPIAALLWWLVVPSLANQRQTRFFLLAMALCLLPTFLTVAQDRVLMGASFGAFGLIASVIVRTAASASWRERVARRVLVTLHLLLAPLMFPVMLGAQHGFENGTQALLAVVKAKQDVILVNSPMELLANYVGGALDRDAQRHRLPNTMHQLYTGGSELWIERVDARTLDVTATRGWGFTSVERIFCAKDAMPKLGATVRVRNMVATVVASTDAGLPKTVRFTFPTPLESPERQWLIWRGTKPIAWQPPTVVGEPVRLAALNLLAALPP